jgi:hypothetical protein
MGIHKDDLCRLMRMDRRRFMAAMAAASGSLTLGRFPAHAETTGQVQGVAR